MDARVRHENRLGGYLKDRRTKLDPASFGLPAGRRRTPGLRREEVAQRANISPTWYTWLEQGRGGAPSADVLDRIARALMLTDVEREHLFLVGLGRPPEARYHAAGGVTPRLQRVLDALDPSPAVIRTAIWDVVAWNRAATVMLRRLWIDAARAAQHPALLLPRPARPGRPVRLGERGAVRARRVQGGRGPRRRSGRGGASRRRALPPQSGVQVDVARQRRPRPPRRSASSTSSTRRSARSPSNIRRSRSMAERT